MSTANSVWGVAQTMAHEFGYGDPYYTMYKNAPSNGPSITNNTSAQSNPSWQQEIAQNNSGNYRN